MSNRFFLNSLTLARLKLHFTCDDLFFLCLFVGPFAILLNNNNIKSVDLKNSFFVLPLVD